MTLDARYSRVHSILFVEVLLMAILLLGCADDRSGIQSGHQPPSENASIEEQSRLAQNTAPVKTTIKETEAITIAEMEYVKQGGSRSTKVTSRVVKKAKNGYWIEVTILPRTPGGHCMVLVLFDGTVSEFQPGA
jgi:hypothetical protein